MPLIPTGYGAAWHRAVGAGLVPVIMCFVYLAGLAPSASAQEADAPMPGSPGVIAGTAGDPVLLRESPGFEAPVLGSLWEGTAVDLLAGPVAAADGSSWFQVAAGQSGFVPAGYVAASQPLAEAETAAPPPPDTVVADAISVDTGAVEAPSTGASEPLVTALPVPLGPTVTNADVNLRAEPSTEAEVLTVLPPGSAIEVMGAPTGAFTPVAANGVSGWVATEYVARAESAAPPMLAAPTIGADAQVGHPATTTDLVNLRAGPSYGDPVLATIPAGIEIAATGAIEAGFFPVWYQGQVGWVASDYLAFGVTDPAPPELLGEEVATDAPVLTVPEAAAPAMRAGLIWPFLGGGWEVIQGYNNGTHTNRSSFANYQYSLDLARTDGATAGQPIYAPASGTVEWVDGGSGGILIDMGNGYGIAMFHLTVDPSIGSGDSIQQGQAIGSISGPGGPGYAGTPHVDLTLWQLAGGGTHVSTPYTGQFAISGQDFPDLGGGNQHMGEEVSV